MKRVLVLAEGQTEERFIKDVLCPHLWEIEIDLIPTIAVTKRVKNGPDFKGGITGYRRVSSDLQRLLSDTGAIAVTTFIDYYGLPPDFPGMTSRPPGNPIQRVGHVETEWGIQIANLRFHPYLMTHEFEALLFSKPDELSAALYGTHTLTRLEEILESFSTPEEINELPECAPSKRILSISPGYQKAVHGPIVARRIGLDPIRDKCAHFNDWISWLESL